MRSTVNKLPARIFYLQVGEQEWYGPYFSLEGLDHRLRKHLKWQRPPSIHRREDWWDDPKIIEMKVGEPTVYFDLSRAER